MDYHSVFNQLPTPSVTMTKDSDGTLLIESNLSLLAYSRRVGDWLIKWAKQKPDVLFIAERPFSNFEQTNTWRALTYSQFYNQVLRLAQSMIDMGLDKSTPVLILSGNSINHALVKMAAMHIGVPVTSLSVAYSAFQGKYDRLLTACESIKPGLIFAESGIAFADALSSIPGDFKIVVSRDEKDVSEKTGKTVYSLNQLMDVKVTESVQLRFDETGPETHAKYMLTSGSTGHPKVVVVTQRMMCSNQQMIAQCMPFIESTPPVVLDWLPWSHTFGTNHNFNLVLRNGGTLYIDDGRPMPSQIDKTVENIKRVKPTLFFNVPKGYEVLLPYLKEDDELARAFFKNLQMIFYAGAALSEPIWNDLKQLAIQHDTEVLMTTEWGSTETAPANTNVHWLLDKPGNIGIPMPGVSIKLVPNQNKMEIRVKGPNVFREYLNDKKMTYEAFDNDGFYRIGDAGRLADNCNPSAGILFDGRISEDFKLSTGTWVCVETMRKRVVESLNGLVTDALITGHNQDYIGIVIFSSQDMHNLAEDFSKKYTAKELLNNNFLKEKLKSAIQEINSKARGSSQQVYKILLADNPPSIDMGEVTDKGNFNQRKLLETRKELVDLIYSEKDCAELITA